MKTTHNLQQNRVYRPALACRLPAWAYDTVWKKGKMNQHLLNICGADPGINVVSPHFPDEDMAAHGG